MACCSFKCTLTGLDIVLSCFVTFPLVAMNWGATWKLCDLYLLPDDELFSALVSLALGAFIGLLGYFLLPILSHLVPVTCNLKHVVISRCFLYVYALGVVNYWRGVWNLLHMVLRNRTLASGVGFLAAELLLLAFRASSNMLASPFIILMDTREYFYDAYPRFRQQVDRLCCYSLDSLFSFFVVHTLVILAWVGLWELMDAYIYPGDTMLSYRLSVAVGLPVAVLYLLLQWPIYAAARAISRCSALGALVFEDAMKLIATVVTLLIWRGALGLMREYVIRDSIFQAWMYHLAGTTGLFLLQTFSTASSIGCEIDAEEGQGAGVLLEVHYTLKWWQQWRGEPTELQEPQNEAPEEPNINSPLLEDEDYVNYGYISTR